MTSYCEIKYVKEVYEEIAEHFNVRRLNRWDWIDLFINSLKKGSLILDVGCGNGRNMTYEDYNFIGIDNCKKFIEICKNKDLEVINSNMTELPFKNGIFDSIICIASFHHLYFEKDKIAALKEMKRVVKLGGKILLSVWSKEQPDKTRKSFRNYGSNIVTWNKYGKVYDRYYYIFKIDEIYNLFKITGLMVKSHERYCGNEVFILIKIN
jgi:ubiquinone/menaquinone biosynthesis C-methylase UbiE